MNPLCKNIAAIYIYLYYSMLVLVFWLYIKMNIQTFFCACKIIFRLLFLHIKFFMYN